MRLFGKENFLFGYLEADDIDGDSFKLRCFCFETKKSFQRVLFAQDGEKKGKLEFDVNFGLVFAIKIGFQ